MKTWLLGMLVLVIGVVGVVGGGAAVVLGVVPGLGASSDSRDTQIVQAIEREQEVVLVSLSIQGLAEEHSTKTVWGVNVPGAGRTLFLQYSLRAKLGIDGQQVLIDQRDEETVHVSIPEFIFIGHDDVEFAVAVEDKGALSWMTPEVDTAALITEILSTEALQEHVTANDEILRDQAQAFYSGIIRGVAPELDVVFEFRVDKE